MLHVETNNLLSIGMSGSGFFACCCLKLRLPRLPYNKNLRKFLFPLQTLEVAILRRNIMNEDDIVEFC